MSSTATFIIAGCNCPIASKTGESPDFRRPIRRTERNLSATSPRAYTLGIHASESPHGNGAAARRGAMAHRDIAATWDVSAHRWASADWPRTPVRGSETWRHRLRSEPCGASPGTKRPTRVRRADQRSCPQACVRRDDHRTCLQACVRRADHRTCLQARVRRADQRSCPQACVRRADHRTCLQACAGRADHRTCLQARAGRADHRTCLQVRVGRADQRSCPQACAWGSDFGGK